MDITIEDYYTPAGLSSGFAVICILISIAIIILVWQTKPRLHTVNHLLICNTCAALILFSMAHINNYVFLIFIPWETSDLGCRWRAYVTYVGMAGTSYSYMIQAISRFFFSVLRVKYRWLTTFKIHYILIFIQWILVFIIISPTVITKDIHFIQYMICFVPSTRLLHIIYAVVVYYIIPVLIIIIIYIYIYYCIRRKKSNATTVGNSLLSQKRDLEVLRNIIILISICLSGGLPTIGALLIPGKIPLLLALTTQTLSVFLATLFCILLDRELCQVVKSIICRRIPVVLRGGATEVMSGV